MLGKKQSNLRRIIVLVFVAFVFVMPFLYSLYKNERLYWDKIPIYLFIFFLVMALVNDILAKYNIVILGQKFERLKVRNGDEFSDGKGEIVSFSGVILFLTASLAFLLYAAIIKSN
jgi:hypothetical protein